jgi:uncharacterized protein YbbK (DUF523 family)
MCLAAWLDIRGSLSTLSKAFFCSRSPSAGANRQNVGQTATSFKEVEGFANRDESVWGGVL